MYRIFLLALIAMSSLSLNAQDYRWQQAVDYVMDIDMDAENHQFDGTQKITYTNNSPDALDKVYYHLYFNAFQPGSMMDMRSLNIADPDRRVGSRISKLSKEEIGYHNIHWIKQDGKEVDFTVKGTVMEVRMNKPIAPNSSTVLEMEFDSQVPLQVRRSGRDSSEGVDFTMTQWYPKLAEYDFQGWHAYPYIGREFHSIWGDFDVTITIDSDYILGGTGVIQNPNEVGGGYQSAPLSSKKSSKKTSWHFVAEDVIDFAWAADPDYTLESIQVPDGPLVYFLYIKSNKTVENWTLLKEKYTIPMFKFMNDNFGDYPSPVYSFIQGGDGGMEYPMCTMITGERGLESLVGVAVHELVHSWFQANLASNESLYAWMDEGFTSYASSETMNVIMDRNVQNPHLGSIRRITGYMTSDMAESGMQHSDHFSSNGAYGVTAYTKGALLLAQLRYIMGDDVFQEGMKNYYDQWIGRHPEPNDFIRVMEKTSGMNLAWFQRLWINTNKTTDYGVKNVLAADKRKTTKVNLVNKGEIPMPTEVTVTFKNGKQRLYYIPLSTMWGQKSFPEDMDVVVLEDWDWTNPNYAFTIDSDIKKIKNVEVDKYQWTVDLDRSNDGWKGKELVDN